MGRDNQPQASDNAPRMGMPEMPYRVSIKRKANGQVVDCVLTIGSMSADRFKGEVPGMLEWFANLNIPGQSQADEYDVPSECPNCGNDEFYDNTGDKKPNFKCKECGHKVFVKRKEKGQGKLPGVE